MILRVRIQNYKSLQDVDIPLRPLTVIIGPNAAGKSNLFDALGLLSRIATWDNLKEAFEPHRGTPLEAFTLPDGGVEELLKRESVRFTLEVDVELSRAAIEAAEQQIIQLREGLESSTVHKRRITERLLRYRVTVEMMTKSGVLRVVDEKLEALNRDMTPASRRRPFIEKVHNRIHLRMEGQAHPSYFEVGLDHSIVSRSQYPPHHPHITAFREELARWRFFFLEPGLMREEQPLERVVTLAANGANLAGFFNSLKASQPKQFDASKRLLAVLVPYLHDLEVQMSPDGFLRLNVQENGAHFSTRVISEGTLRILGLIAILTSPSPATLVGYEEPENGVHPRRLQLIAEMLQNSVRPGDMQILVNTHSPFLPVYFKNEDILICRRGGKVSEFRPFPAEAPLLKGEDVAHALEEPLTPLYERIVRGDYGG
jgi:predicted ATPase